MLSYPVGNSGTSVTTDPTKPQPVRPNELANPERQVLRRIRTWPAFHRQVRTGARRLLNTIDQYPAAVLVAGCQRSGTTMLTRIIASSPGFRPLALTKDDELDAALALSGKLSLPTGARYCLQTTYLNEHFEDYARMREDQRLIWVLRNPKSVVHSMVYNWGRFALNELYDSCGKQLAVSTGTSTSSWPWPFGPSAMEKAYLAYSGKSSQIQRIAKIVPSNQLLLVDYDELVSEPDTHLPKIFDHIGRTYEPELARRIKTTSLRKAETIDGRRYPEASALAAKTYNDCLELLRAKAERTARNPGND